MDYTALNPYCWGCFIAFWVIVFSAVKMFHAKYPDYPWGPGDKGKEHLREYGFHDVVE
jgi:hypothetical protein